MFVWKRMQDTSKVAQPGTATRQSQLSIMGYGHLNAFAEIQYVRGWCFGLVVGVIAGVVLGYFVTVVLLYR